MRQTKEATEQTRVALLDAAEALFWEQGTARTSILDIVRGAGLTRGAFYYHFKDKAAIFEALIARVRSLDKLLPKLDDESAADRLVVLRDFCESVFEVFAKGGSQQRMFGIVMHGREALGDMEALAHARREEICRSSQIYQRLFEQAQSAGRLAPGWTPQIAAVTLYSTILGLLDQWLRTPERFDICEIGSACIGQLFASFEGGEGI